MRGHVDGFEDWYAAVQAAFRDDPLMGLFDDLRTTILKRGTVPGIELKLRWDLELDGDTYASTDTAEWGSESHPRASAAEATLGPDDLTHAGEPVEDLVPAESVEPVPRPDASHAQAGR